MNVDILKLLEATGLKEPLYPGKKFVQPFLHNGEFKSNAVVFDWRDPSVLKIQVKAGPTGRDLTLEDLKNYPLSFQAPTHVHIEVVNETDNGTYSDEEEEGTRGKSGSDGRAMKKKKGSALGAFAKTIEGAIPALGRVTEIMIMGKTIAAEAFGQVLDTLTQQIATAKVAPVDLLAKAGDFVTRYTPPAFLQPKGDEQATYKYDREKNEIMFGAVLS